MDEKEFMQKQIHEIELAKYYEGIRIGRDPGDEFVRKWIKDNAEAYREANNPSGTNQT
jgi:hypothetical protein